MTRERWAEEVKTFLTPAWTSTIASLTSKPKRETDHAHRFCNTYLDLHFCGRKRIIAIECQPKPLCEWQRNEVCLRSKLRVFNPAWGPSSALARLEGV